MILAKLAPPEEGLNPLNVARGVATALEAENREVNDLAGLWAGRHHETRSIAHLPLLLPPSPSAGDGSVAPKHRDYLADFVARRYLDRESSLEELIFELYCGNLSVSRAEKIVRALWGRGTDLSLVSRHGGEIERRIQHWLRRPIPTRYPYVFLQGSLLKVGKAGQRESRGVYVAVGFSGTGIREVLALRLVAGTVESGWQALLDDLRDRGLAGTQLFLGDNDPRVIAAVSARFPGALYQGDFAQMERAVLQEIPPALIPVTADALAAARDDAAPSAARTKLVALQETLERGGNARAAAPLGQALPYLYSYARFPAAHWAQFRTGRSFTKVMRDCRELIRIGGADPNPDDVRLLMAARWRRASRVWARRKIHA